MKTIACYSMKGGAGKTTCAVNLAYIASRQGNPVLLWDLEPQGASSFYFRIKPKLKGGGAALLSGKHELSAYIKATDFAHLDLLPADFSFRNMDLQLEDCKKPVRRLHKLLKPLSGEYAYVFIDCPPSSSLLAEAVLHAADRVLTPLTPTPLALENFARLQKFVAEQKFTCATLLPFLSMLDRRKALHRDIEKQIRDSHPEVLAAVIPYSGAVERMAVERLPLGAFAAKTQAAIAYEQLWEEVKRQLDAGEEEIPQAVSPKA